MGCPLRSVCICAVACATRRALRASEEMRERTQARISASACNRVIDGLQSNEKALRDDKSDAVSCPHYRDQLALSSQACSECAAYCPFRKATG